MDGSRSREHYALLSLRASHALWRTINWVASLTHSSGYGSPGRHLGPGLSSQVPSKSSGINTYGTLPGIGGEYLMTSYGLLLTQLQAVTRIHGSVQSASRDATTGTSAHGSVFAIFWASSVRPRS